MNFLDIVLIIVLLVGFILGYKDGLARKIIGFIGFCLAIYLSMSFSDEVGIFIFETFGTEIYLAKIFGGVIIFLIIIFITSILKRVIHPFDKVNNLVNQITGGLIGLIQIVYFLSAALFLMGIFSFPSEDTISNSMLYSKIYDILPDTLEYLSDYTPDTKELIKELIIDQDTLQ